MSIPWTDAQLELLALHWRHMTDAELAPLLSANGPIRTPKGIESFRHARGWKRRQPFKTEAGRELAMRGALKSIDNQGGWPLMVGSPEERERRYLRLMFEGMRDEHVRLEAKRCVA